MLLYLFLCLMKDNKEKVTLMDTTLQNNYTVDCSFRIIVVFDNGCLDLLLTVNPTNIKTNYWDTS